MADAVPMRRCAIYTRKSSEEGLDQAFNSLDAQRDACAAYIASQKLEGWTLVDRIYDDGGLSGGSLNRPALQRLIADIEAGLVNTVVVYKIDRLTRSLADFARLTELFDKRGASFVAVTQQFNTSTSMGRLTLNVLLSFAQFEREVAGERIRDKIAASKRRGMWMGGHAPLGYLAKGRTLEVEPKEAATVRHIYERYLELGSVRELQKDLEVTGIRSKTYRDEAGNAVKGGSVISRGALYLILQNPIYRGLIPHKTKTYPGNHPAIIDKSLYTEVQKKLASQGPGEEAKTKTQSRALLAGLLVDDTGDRLLPSHSKKAGRRYRYYVSNRIIRGPKDPTAFRIPASDLEQFVISTLAAKLRDAEWVTSHLGMAPALLDRMTELTAKIERQNSHADGLLQEIISQIVISRGELNIRVNLDKLRPLVQAPSSSSTDLPHIDVATKSAALRCGKQVKIVIDPHEPTAARQNEKLIADLVQARQWFADLSSGKAPSIAALSKRSKCSAANVSRKITLAFLAPDIVKSIVQGTQPLDLTVEKLRRACPLPASWDDQRALLLA